MRISDGCREGDGMKIEIVAGQRARDTDVFDAYMFLVDTTNTDIGYIHTFLFVHNFTD